MDTKPWGSYSESDYTLEQWYNACLIRPPKSDLESKSQCKLPIKTPSGVVNKNAIFAAAAALAGARTPIKASTSEKSKAARTLIRYYREMDKEPPESLTKMSSTIEMSELLNDISDVPVDELKHYGVKGMKWGVRKDQSKSNQISNSTNQQKKFLTSEQKKARAKKIAIGVGVLTIAAGASYAAYKLKTDGQLDTSSMKKSGTKNENGKKAVADILESPKAVMFATRSYSRGFRFLENSGLERPISVFEKAGLISGENEIPINNIRKLPDGSVAAVLGDPEGRKDQGTRLIPHSILIPKTMSEGIDSIDDVRDKIWPKLKPAYDEFFNSDPEVIRIRKKSKVE